MPEPFACRTVVWSVLNITDDFRSSCSFALQRFFPSPLCAISPAPNNWLARAKTIYGRHLFQRQLKLAMKDAALATCFFDADFHAADAGVRKFLLYFAADFTGNMFRQQLGARVDEREKNYVLPRQ